MGSVFFPLIFNRPYRLLHGNWRLQWRRRLDRLEDYLRTLPRKEP